MQLYEFIRGAAEVLSQGGCQSYELLRWINLNLSTHFATLEELKSGAAWCQMLHIASPRFMDLAAVRFCAQGSSDSIQNFMLLRDAAMRSRETLEMSISQLVAGDHNQHLKLGHWMIRYHLLHYDGRAYDALQQRAGQPFLMLPENAASNKLAGRKRRNCSSIEEVSEPPAKQQYKRQSSADLRPLEVAGLQNIFEAPPVEESKSKIKVEKEEQTSEAVPAIDEFTLIFKLEEASNCPSDERQSCDSSMTSDDSDSSSETSHTSESSLSISFASSSASTKSISSFSSVNSSSSSSSQKSSSSDDSIISSSINSFISSSSSIESSSESDSWAEIESDSSAPSCDMAPKPPIKNDQTITYSKVSRWLNENQMYQGEPPEYQGDQMDDPDELGLFFKNMLNHIQGHNTQNTASTSK